MADPRLRRLVGKNSATPAYESASHEADDAQSTLSTLAKPDVDSRSDEEVEALRGLFLAGPEPDASGASEESESSVTANEPALVPTTAAPGTDTQSERPSPAPWSAALQKLFMEKDYVLYSFRNALQSQSMSLRVNRETRWGKDHLSGHTINSRLYWTSDFPPALRRIDIQIDCDDKVAGKLVKQAQCFASTSQPYSIRTPIFLTLIKSGKSASKTMADILSIPHLATCFAGVSFVDCNEDDLGKIFGPERPDVQEAMGKTIKNPFTTLQFTNCPDVPLGRILQYLPQVNEVILRGCTPRDFKPGDFPQVRLRQE